MITESKNHVKNIEIDSDKHFSFSTRDFDVLDDLLNNYNNHVITLSILEASKLTETTFELTIDFDDGRCWSQTIDYTDSLTNPRMNFSTTDFFTLEECFKKMELREFLTILMDRYHINTLEVTWL